MVCHARIRAVSCRFFAWEEEEEVGLPPAFAATFFALRKKASLTVICRHGFPLHQGDPAPDPCAIRPPCLTASRF